MAAETPKEHVQQGAQHIQQGAQQLQQGVKQGVQQGTQQAQQTVQRVGQQAQQTTQAVKSAASEEPKGLKRLGVVQRGTAVAYALAGQAEKVYKTAKTYTPAFAAPTVDKLEDTAVAYTAPLVAKAQDVGDKLLHYADDQVDYIMNTTLSAVNSGKQTVQHGAEQVKELHSTGTKTFSSAAESYFDLLARTADWAADKLNPVKGAKAASDTFQAVLAKAREATDPDVAVAMAYDAWTKFASLPPVAAVLSTAEPATKLGLQSFYKLHDTLVTLPLYKTAVDTSASVAAYAKETFPVKLATAFFYPILQPVADPALEKINKSKVINQAINYWKPSATV